MNYPTPARPTHMRILREPTALAAGKSSSADGASRG